MTIIPFPDKKCGCGTSKEPVWLTLPVAPQAVARSCFAGDEKLPSAVPLYGALTWITDQLEQGACIAGLDLAGPGDPLASLPLTLEILTQLKENFPELPLALTTLGMGLADQAGKLALHGASRIILQVDAVQPATLEKLYQWIRPAKRNMPLAKAAVTLTEEQSAAMIACKSAGLPVQVLCTVYKGINESEVAEISRRFAELGADTMALQSGKGYDSAGEKLAELSPQSLAALEKEAATHLEIVPPPAHSIGTTDTGSSAQATLPKPTESRPNVAVLSSNGMDIDLHLGQAIQALIYGPREDGLACLLSARDLPEPGSGDDRWLQLAEALNDCFVLLATSAGQRPRDILAKQGLPVVLIDDNVEGTVDVLYGGGKKGKKGRK